MNKIILTTVISSLTLTSCSYLNVAGRNMRTKGAPFVPIASVGYKNYIGLNQFEATSYQPEYNMEGRFVSAMLTTKVKKHLVKVGYSPKINGSVDIDSNKTGLFKLYDVKTTWKDAFNKNATQKQKFMLMKWGSQARVITAVAKVYDHNDTSTRALTLGAEKVNLPNGAKIDFKTENTSTKTKKFSDGTSYAYEVSQIAWVQDSKGLWEVADLIADRPGRSGINSAKMGWTYDPLGSNRTSATFEKFLAGSYN